MEEDADVAADGAALASGQDLAALADTAAVVRGADPVADLPGAEVVVLAEAEDSAALAAEVRAEVVQAVAGSRT